MPARSRSDSSHLPAHGDRLLLSGVQALVRAPLLQREADRLAGLATAGFVTGYRGSPLGGLDTALHEAQPALDAHDVRFWPAVNEDLAATAVWGTQQLGLLPQGAEPAVADAPPCDGIFSMWYGKGPGVDRCADVFKHANFAGTAAHGGVLVVAGDDHAARSSGTAHQSEHLFSACAMPVLAPADVQDILDFSQHGWAMSRASGCWVAMKLAADVVESAAVVEVDAHRVRPVAPEGVQAPGGVHIRWPDPPPVQEHRMAAHKVYAALAYARANGIDRLVFDTPHPRLGVVACGKAWSDLRQALAELGIGEVEAAALGLRVYKVGMPWPLEASGARRFARGLEEILVVEEKRQIIEYQLKEMLYDWPDAERPRVVGKFDETGEWPAPQHQWLLPPTGDLSPALVAAALVQRLQRLGLGGPWAGRALALRPEAGMAHALAPRTPYFCSGCPHNRSTRVPEGSCALAGVGCHLMAMWMERGHLTVSQMGGEGATWIGMAPHAGVKHVFANMGDGTYFHSGLLAIRAAVTAGVNITYKILYNDAVAMTGGQPVDGPLSVPRITRQLAAEGVRDIVVLADPARSYADDDPMANGVRRLPLDALDEVQRELRGRAGVSALVYDQVCATEGRRRRVRDGLPPPARHVFINEAVCDGCGDCGTVSNCLSVVPVNTEFGEKRRIDAASCNQDLGCLAGRCPALVTVQGTLRRGAGVAPPDEAGLPEPVLPVLSERDAPYAILVAGVGGSGVVTLGALIGAAAQAEGLGVTLLDQTGLAQKGGAVLSHVRLAPRQDLLHAPRIVHADLLIGCDLAVAAGADALRPLVRGRTRAVVNMAEAMSGERLRHPALGGAGAAARAALEGALESPDWVDASRLAGLLAGAPIAANIFLLGYAWQRGWLPVGRDALRQAVWANGVAVDTGRRAFAWGRWAAHDAALAERAAAEAEPRSRRFAKSLDEAVAWRRAELVAYQGEALAARYESLVARVRRIEQQRTPGSERLALAVARHAFRLYAAKDEYEVARLFGASEFRAALDASFEPGYHVQMHFAPPWQRGELLRKRTYGEALAQPALNALAAARHLRDTAFDPLAGHEEHRLSRELADGYEETVARLLGGLDDEHLDAAVAIAELPQGIRGFGPVRQRNAERVLERQAALLAEYEAA